MQTIAAADIVARMRFENPWWAGSKSSVSHMTRRAYFDLFLPLILTPIRRAVVLLGPRRVGKTVMIHQAIDELIARGVPAASLCYVSVDHPIYNGLSIDELITYHQAASGWRNTTDPTYIFFDEIQYLRNWEAHLKNVVDGYPSIKAVASGSSAAALRLRSTESGAGRFTDFLLPPLTFYEYLLLLKKTDLVRPPTDTSTNGSFFITEDIDQLNAEFIKYLNFGGYPEVIFSEQIQADPARFIKSDIVDKVLLRDLPSLYGIENIQELNYLFTTLAFNTASEVSLQELSQNSGVAKNTIKRYIEYLEAAFLIKTVHRIDHTAKRFNRANFFKVYLTNPSMRAALFSPVGPDDHATTAVAETAIYAQWFHSDEDLFYARWQDGEIDMVSLDDEQQAFWAVEVKWSDAHCSDAAKCKSAVSFGIRNELSRVLMTTRSITSSWRIGGLPLRFLPTSIYCYTVGYNIIHGKKDHRHPEEVKDGPGAPSPTSP